MALTRLDILSEAANNVGRKLATVAADGTTTFKSRLITALNESVQPWVARGVVPPSDQDPGTPNGFMFTEFNKTADMSTSNGTKAYSWPVATDLNFREAYDLTLVDGSNSRQLSYLSRRKLDALFPDPTTWPSKARPKWYTRFGKGFEVLPIPDAAYTLRARMSVWPQDLTSDTQTPDLIYKDDLMVARLTGEAFAMLQEYEADASEWYAKSVTLLRDAIAGDPRDWDWEPVVEAYLTAPSPVGEYWKNPFVGLGSW